jgi:catechol 2,3-dioxygenase-like lactoylglutathione lyase family enzyme
MDDRPVLDQINLVVRDMDAMVGFYRRLGLEIPATGEAWDRDHRSATMPGGHDFDLDSTAFAQQWDVGWPEGTTGPVLGFRVEARETVDAIYADLTGNGAVGQQPPYDAFWGARYAIVVDPDGNDVGIMSPRDDTMRSWPPTQSPDH